MLAKTRTSLLVILGMVLGASLTLGQGVFALRDNSAESMPLNELRNLTDVLTRIKKNYVEEVSDKELLENAIRGMLSGLDPHSSFLNEEEFKELKVGTTGQFGGLGIEVSMEDGFVKVVSPIDDTPAQKAGVQSGDLIIRLDDQPVKGLTLNDAVKIMRGKPGTDILLTIAREGAGKPLKIKVTRAIIRVNSVKRRLLDEDFGYVRISSFQVKTTTSLLEAIEELIEENKKPLKGLVLDLRNNPGGVLSAAVGVSDAFLKKGLIVYTEGRVSDSELRYNATPGDAIDGAALILLINGGSASASEIVAGALQDHKRAVILGTKSFGKGSVQTIQELNGGGAVKLTTARYYTPSGRSIQAEGIEPDIKVARLTLEKQKKSADEIKPLTEANLNGHLTNGNADKDGQNKEATDKSSEKDKTEDKSTHLAEEDYALYEALNMLKGLAILQASH
ncbi:MAG: S41 family peptidase [Gammaproteobacteria bacterium]|nr:S41 family peptidase [Gammaproteobacteria bacterium]